MQQQQPLDFSQLIQFVRDLPQTTKFSAQLHIGFIGFIVGKLQNDQMALKKALYLVIQINNEEKEQRMFPQDIIALYDNFFNQNADINEYVPDSALDYQEQDDQENQQSQISQNAIYENNPVQEVIIQQEQIEQVQGNQEIQNNQKPPNMSTESQILGNKKSQIQQPDQQSKIEQKVDVLDDQIPKIKQIKLLQQSQILKQQQKQQFQNDYQQFKKQSQIIIQKKQPIQIREIQICTICLDEMNKEDQFLLTSCQHHFHKKCLIHFVNNQQIYPLICPFQGCKKEIHTQDLDQICDQQLKNRLEQNATNLYFQKSLNIFQCPSKGCEGIYEIEGPIQVCILCHKAFCTKCRKGFHEGICGESSFIKLAKKENYSQCYMCFKWVEKAYGCNHIKCICGHEFCYNCGKQWVGEECKCIETDPRFRQQRLVQKLQ